MPRRAGYANDSAIARTVAAKESLETGTLFLPKSLTLRCANLHSLNRTKAMLLAVVVGFKGR
ncbi:MAG: hypothetical protein F6J93_38065 [Oscillatoria sp. SIO1A7]|nr:hypothetical protein [Oscillatoria sp. SIO1A7]